MRTRIRAYLLRRLLGLKLDTDVAIVSVIDNEPIITHGVWFKKRSERWPIDWHYTERVH